MAQDKEITQLPVASVIFPDDVMVMVDVEGNLTCQFTFAQLIDFLGANQNTGAQISFGTSTPSNATGANGDIFINTTTGQFLQKIEGAWVSQFTITQGVVGSVIYYGVSTPNPANGINGDTYIQTSGGLFYSKISGTWTLEFTMATGPAGATGAAGTNGTNGTNGNTILNGTTNPSNGLGANGDFYLNTLTGTFYGPKAAGAWPTPGVSIAYQPVAAARLDIAKGSANPIVVTAYQSTYAAIYGADPTLLVQTVIANAIATFGALTGGSGYAPGTYNNVPLTNGTGSGALATIVVNGSGVITSVVLVNSLSGYMGGTGYAGSDNLSAANSNLGGSGSGFSIIVSSLQQIYNDSTLTASRTFDNTGNNLQAFTVNDPDPSNAAITGDQIRIIIKA